MKILGLLVSSAQNVYFNFFFSLLAEYLENLLLFIFVFTHITEPIITHYFNFSHNNKNRVKITDSSILLIKIYLCNQCNIFTGQVPAYV